MTLPVPGPTLTLNSAAGSASGKFPASTAALSPSNPSVTTPGPNVTVSVPNTSGAVTFELVVTDSLGNQSAPAFVTVEIQGVPVAVLTATPESVEPGAAITLSGAGSSSAGSIASYTFTLVTAAAIGVDEGAVVSNMKP
jgi:hypothetical protein